MMLLDTNVIIDLVDATLPALSGEWLETAMITNRHRISVITRIELFSKLVNPDTTRVLVGFVRFTEVLGLDEPIIQQTIQLRQQHRIKLPDAIIAATALAHGFPLLTRNTADFKNIAGLTVLNPHDPSQFPSL